MSEVPGNLSCYRCGKPTPASRGALCEDCSHEAATMMTCPDCKGRVSQRAPTCIHCGAPLQGIQPVVAAPSQRATSNGVFFGVLRLALFFGGALILLYGCYASLGR